MLIKEQRHANTKHICSTLKFTSLENQPSNCFYYQTLNYLRTAGTVSLRLRQLMKFWFSHDSSQILESTFEQLSAWMFPLTCPRNPQIFPKNPSKMMIINPPMTLSTLIHWKLSNALLKTKPKAFLRTRFFYMRKFFIRKWASKILKPYENFQKISSLKCLTCNF